MATDPYLTRSQLAEVLQVSTRTVDRWRRAGLPWHRPGGGRGTVLFDLAEVQAWVKITYIASGVAA